MTLLAGRYRLSERIAAGGMGEVWRADDMVLGRSVAVKVLKAEYADSHEFRLRFSREAQHAAALSHPGVAQMYDSGDGQDGQPPYLVMELIDGEPLSALLSRQGRLAPEHTADIVAQAAAALGAAHRSGLVHRDVKPGNLLICQDGRVKITDFGIARAVDAAPLTQVDTVVGTPLYLSPEQAAGQQATAASDLYALGVVAYECFNGRPPFEGDPVAVTLAHRDQPLPRSIPGPLGDLVAALTAKDPARRPANAAEVAEWAGGLATGAGGSAAAAAAAATGGDDAGATRIGLPAVGYPAGTDPAGRGGPMPFDDPYEEEYRPSRRGLFLAAGGAAIAVAAGGFGWLLRGSPTGTTGEPSPTGDDAAGIGDESAQPAPAARTVKINPDEYRGRPVTQVVQQLRRLGLRPEVRRERVRRRPGTVLRVAPSGEVREGTKITVVAAAPPRRRDGKDERGGKDDGDNSGSGNGGGGGGKGKG